MDIKNKTVIGPIEQVSIKGYTALARIDTGATTSSIDLGLANELKLRPLVAKKIVVSAHGKRVRPVVEVEIKLKGRVIKASFTVINRLHMKYPILIGRNILKQGFLIDLNRVSGKE